MSTKSLDLSLPLGRHQRNLSNDLSSHQFTKDLKTKIDGHKVQCYEELGAKLIEDRLLLTALELYAELGEAGHEILCLKQFFSNPGNFEKSAKSEISRMLVRSLSQTTLDSLDYATISEDGDRAGGDRVAILEFELRKAKETITALRENLTQQVELENASTRSETESSSSRNNAAVTNHQSAPEPIRAYEQRAINFLVHEYLLTHGYRLTSITFSDENTEQDFEHWDDVGLNTERPPDLLSIFRLRTKPVIPAQSVQTQDVETQTDDFLHESDSADVTMQMSCGTNAEESVINQSEDVPVQSTAPAKPIAAIDPPSSTAHNPVSSSVSLPFTGAAPTSIQQPPLPTTNMRPAPPPTYYSAPFPQPAHLQNSAKALKDELQQGVEDVCQKLNNFFGKPQSLPGSNPRGSRTSTDRPSSFSLFNNK